MKFGIQHPSFSFDGQGEQIVESLRRLATTAEQVGYDSFWAMDHFHQIGYVGQPQDPMLEGWTTISTIAACTSKIRVGTLVTGNIYRHPSVLAKIAATLDVLSKGRIFLGIGAGWNEEESNAYGILFPSTKERFRRLEESVQIIRKMWTEDRATFNGRYYQIKDAYCNPKPIQKPHPPIMIGGSGERETLKLVAKYADACNLFGSPETVKRKLNVLRKHCRAIKRDYDSILKTRLGLVMIDTDKTKLESRVAILFKNFPPEQRKEMSTVGTPEEVRQQVEEFRDAGIQYSINMFESSRELEAIQQFADEVIRRL